MTADSLAVPRFSRNGVSRIYVSHIIQALEINFEHLDTVPPQSPFARKYFKALKAFIALGFALASKDNCKAFDYQARLRDFTHSCKRVKIEGAHAYIPTSSSLIYFLRFLHFALSSVNKADKQSIAYKKFINALARLVNTVKTRKAGLAPLLAAELMKSRCINIGERKK